MNKLKKLLIPFQNLASLFLGFFNGRSKKCVLFGSWGGQKFADNSRFLFLYLSQNANKLGLRRVVWATRNKSLHDFLVSEGFDSCLIGTQYSKKCHLKCGIHIICNMAFGFGAFESDIDTRYSCGARKIQLWHGVSVKAIGKASNHYRERKKHLFNRIIDGKVLGSLFSLGLWNNEYFLCTSELNKDIILSTCGCNKKRAFISSYPRNCLCPLLTDDEKSVISKFQQYKGVVLYLPTFRSNFSLASHPLSSNEFLNYLKANNLLFVEKPHSASNHIFNFDNPNVLSLDQSFDVNVLYDYCSCVISDYSSSGFDSVHKKKPTIIFVPDLEYFKSDDVGLIMDINDIFNHLICNNIAQVIRSLDKVLSLTFFDSETEKIYNKIDEMFFASTQKSLDQIWEDILIAIE